MWLYTVCVLGILLEHTQTFTLRQIPQIASKKRFGTFIEYFYCYLILDCQT